MKPRSTNCSTASPAASTARWTGQGLRNWSRLSPVKRGTEMIRKAALLFACAAFAPNAFAQDTLNGRYNLTLTAGGAPLYGVLELKQDGNALTGKYRGDDLTGTRQGDSVTFVARDKEGGRSE